MKISKSIDPRSIGGDEVVSKRDECRAYAKLFRVKTGWAKSLPIHGDSVASDFSSAANVMDRLAESFESLSAKIGEVDWKPIQTAPDDGSLFLAESRYGNYRVMLRKGDRLHFWPFPGHLEQGLDINNLKEGDEPKYWCRPQTMYWRNEALTASKPYDILEDK